MQVVDEQGIPYTTSQVLSAEPWTPSPYTAFKVSNEYSLKIWTMAMFYIRTSSLR